MALTAQDKIDIARTFARKMFQELNGTANLDTDEIVAMISDLDDYLEANQNEVNAAIRPAVRAKASLQQKGAALALAAMRRVGLV
jgi:hypothetical protein